MEHQYSVQGEQTFLLINGPLIFLGFMANLFYVYCLVFPSRRSKLKQPLKMLLGVLLWCSITYLVLLSSTYRLLSEPENFEACLVSWMFVLNTVHSNMVCSGWMSFYYYVQIVPSQRALLIWVKRHIRSFICVAFLFDEIFIWICSAMTSAKRLLQGFTCTNSTQTEHCNSELDITNLVSFWIVKLRILCCLCVMTVCNFSIVRYLCRHIKSVAHFRVSKSTPGSQSQMRTAACGLFQGVLFLLHGTFYFIDSFTYTFSAHSYFSAWFSLTATTLYMSGTTVTLGIGQAAFRQRAADVWKAFTALCGWSMVSMDAKMHTSQ